MDGWWDEKTHIVGLLKNPTIWVKKAEKSGILKEYRTFLMAEKEGFEPSIPFWGIHDFQSCALGQLRDFSVSVGCLLLTSI